MPNGTAFLVSEPQPNGDRKVSLVFIDAPPMQVARRPKSRPVPKPSRAEIRADMIEVGLLLIFWACVVFTIGSFITGWFDVAFRSLCVTFAAGTILYRLQNKTT